MAKKKVSKKKLVEFKNFDDWWDKIALKQVSKIERKWLKQNEPNDSEDDEGGDHWHINRMMHEGDAHNMTYDIAEHVFDLGLKGDKWEPNMSDSLFCDLDNVILQAYEAGKKLKS